ncbi:MAG TPA: XrtA/PEP-CTERM system histidine kinase PrsK [Gammaproteobacteria bacterium]|nr:XrtA/PEP-CTERM system histidine kinase PrsK [Gammaproteobacteria bacterium]
MWLAYSVWWVWAAPLLAVRAGGRVGLSLVAGGLLTALLGLALVEQIYRNLRPEKRWAVKYLCLGLGAIFVYDLYLYSYTVLLHAIDPTVWDARGAVNALAVPLIAVSAARNPRWSADVFVSRRVAFHTATLMGAGLYLLAMAGGGYFVREVGGTWGRFAEILFFAGAIVVLLVILFSGQVRARLRVLLSKHFFTYKYDYREEWLRLVGQLYTDKLYSDPYERAIVAVADIVESPGGGIWMRRESNGFDLAAGHSLRVPDSARVEAEAPLIAFLRERQWIVDVRELADKPALYAGLTLPAWLADAPQAWLVVPLLHEEALVGFLVLARSRAPMALTWEDRDLLKAVGRQVGGFLAHYEDARALSEARQFQAYNRVTTFLMHDLKNVMAQQSLLVRNAERHKTNPAFVDDMISTVEHSVQRMGRLLEQLRRGGGRDEVERVDVGEIVQRAVARCADREPRARVDIDSQAGRIRVEPDTLMMVVSHIVRNAQDATPVGGEVSVRVASRGERVLIEVQDNGCGMDATFVRTRLFEPFYTTKSSKGMGIGAYQAREFARGAGGDVEVDSEPGRGTRFRLWFPAAQPQPEAASAGVGA